jgi:hypothetical protein
LEKGWVGPRTNAVYDPEFTRALADLPWKDWFSRPNPLRCREDYLDCYLSWITKSKYNRFHGLESYAVRHLTNGTTQSFDESYYRYKSRRLRILRGEYAYHKRAFPNWHFVEDGPLESNDFLIVSVPFCSTGECPAKFYDLLDQAHHLNVPVIVDCAYFGTCHGVEVDLSHPGIENVCFSLTKGVGLGDIRSGIRFSRTEDDGPIAQQNRYNHTVLGAAKIGLYMMEQFSPDFIPGKYLEIQQQVCREVGLRPTPCMHLALGDDRWNQFNIDDRYNRLGIRELIKARRKGWI